LQATGKFEDLHSLLDAVKQTQTGKAFLADSLQKTVEGKEILPALPNSTIS
jgi:hypothetical protein